MYLLDQETEYYYDNILSFVEQKCRKRMINEKIFLFFPTKTERINYWKLLLQRDTTH